MNRSIRILSALAFISCIISCKKSTNSGDDKKAAGSTLSKVIVWDAAQPQKEIKLIEFKYDNLNRVTEIVYSSGDSVNGAINSFIVRTNKCFYNGNETNPYKTIGFKLPIGYPSGDVYHYYNNAGALIADSTGTWRVYTGYYKRELAWFSDKIITTHTNTYAGFLQQTKDTMSIDGNNITGYYTTLTGTIDVFNYKYDNKINPLTKLNIAAFTVIDGTDGIDGFIAPGYCKNNITEIVKKSSRVTVSGIITNTSTTNYTYSYNELGLPIERLVNGTSKPTITKYYYTKTDF